MVWMLLLAMAVRCQIDRELFDGVSNMVGWAPQCSHLYSDLQANAEFGRDSFQEWELKGKIDFEKPIEIKFMGRIIFRWVFKPFEWMRALKFGTNARIKSLTFANNIVASGSSTVTATALIGHRNGNAIEIRTGSASATLNVRQQYITQTVRKCTKILFWEDCKNETVNTPRGLYQHELDSLLAVLQSSAASKLRETVGRGVGLLGDQGVAALGNEYQEEGEKVRGLYEQQDYVFQDAKELELGQLVNSVRDMTQGMITDEYVFSRIYQLGASVARARVLAVANTNPNHFFVVHLTKEGVKCSVRVSKFKVAQNLPVGAFAVSLGSWALERYGQGATPSIHQLLGLFRPL